jgi:uncharacterized protein YrrD
MLRKAKALKGYKLESLDGEIGKIKEFYFDDRHWTIRYLVADTGNWLTGRQVLIREEQHLEVQLTKKQIEDSPSLNSDKPVSRQFEEVYFDYHGWPLYWNGPNVWGRSNYLMRVKQQRTSSSEAEKVRDPHLRSTHDVSGHHIQATDGEIGHVEDFIIDDQTWAIRYLIIDTRNWWPRKMLLVSPQWIERVSWSESKVFVNLPREMIKQAPEYDGSCPLTRGYETKLHQHYSREGYWTGDNQRKEMAHSRE